MDQIQKKRILGIDVARAIAVAGMIIVNFKVVFGETGDSWLKPFANFFFGKAAAVFVVLAGIGLAMMTNKAVEMQDLEKLKTAQKKIFKRAIFLFIVGLSYSWIWPADILHFYGVYMCLTLFFINRPTKQLFIAAVSIILVFPILVLFLDYNKGWIFEIWHYTDFWTLNGFFRNLLFNGFHPVVPWLSFMFFGLWYGRQNLYDETFLKKSFKISLAVFLSTQALTIGLSQWIYSRNAKPNEFLQHLFGTAPMPPLPFYMINGISVAIVLISTCILIANKYENNWLIRALNRTGQLALTFYVAHVVIGMGVMADEDSAKFGKYSIDFSVTYALTFSLLCIVFANIWLRFRKSGPLEWLMRKLTD
ncbi:MAG: DUF418 domain-containing protein [Spirochaetota bacterium]